MTVSPTARHRVLGPTRPAGYSHQDGRECVLPHPPPVPRTPPPLAIMQRQTDVLCVSTTRADWDPGTSGGSRGGPATWAFTSDEAGVVFRPVAAVYHGSDSQDVALYDPELAKYVAFRRVNNVSERVCNACVGGGSRLQPKLPHAHSTTCAYECPGAEQCAGCPGYHEFRCNTTADCEAETCRGQPVKCTAAGRCQANVSDQGTVLCLQNNASKVTKYGGCGVGPSADRYVGRCESSEWGRFDGCDTSSGSGAGPILGRGLSVVFGPDEDDSPCVDLCE